MTREKIVEEKVRDDAVSAVIRLLRCKGRKSLFRETAVFFFFHLLIFLHRAG